MQNGSEQTPLGCVKKVASATSHYGETILTVIAREYGHLRHASKILAKHARSSHRTAEGWLSGRNVPSGANLINLLNECDALADEVLRRSSEQKNN